MADPLLDTLLDETPEPETPPAPEVDEEKERLRKENEALLKAIETQGSQINDLRQQFSASQVEAPAAPDEAAFYADPQGESRRIAREVLVNEGGPQLREMNTKMGRMVLSGFLATKTGDRFYAGAQPFFSARMKDIPLDQLGSAPDAIATQTLNIAWDAAVGQFIQAEAVKRPIPPNIGGGGSGGGGVAKKKTLMEIDPRAYNMAVAAGMTDEQMQAIADEEQE